MVIAHQVVDVWWHIFICIRSDVIANRYINDQLLNHFAIFFMVNETEQL
jgi:hypothetical protein